MKFNLNLSIYIITIIFVCLFTRCDTIFSKSKNSIKKIEIDSLYEKSSKLFDNGDIEIALEGYKKVIDDAKYINYKDILPKTFVSVAICYYELSIPDQGSKYLIEAEQISKGNPELLAKISILKGFILFNANLYDEAEKKFIKTIDYAKNIKDKEISEMLVDRSYINIGNIHLHHKDHETTLKYYFKGLKSSNIPNKLGSAINIAEIYVLSNKIDSASKYLKYAEENIYTVKSKKLYNYINNGLKGVKGFYEKIVAIIIMLLRY